MLVAAVTEALADEQSRMHPGLKDCNNFKICEISRKGNITCEISQYSQWSLSLRNVVDYYKGEGERK